jgi:CheY-like chemotaxis protein
MEAVGTLATAIAHDFGNLLQVMTGSATLALAEPGRTEEVGGNLRNVIEAAQRGATLVNQLMTFCHKGVVRPSPAALDGVIEELGGLIARLVGASVRVDLATTSGAVVMADRVQIEQLLMNLASNARDAMPDGGLLRIATDVVSLAKDLSGDLMPGRYVRLTVSDSGCGMDAETLARAFEPFFTTKAPGVGTGLGLSTVFTIVKGLAGRIDIESAPGRGTSFVILLPCSDDAVAQVPAVAAPQRFEGRVLLVEDGAPVRMVVRRQLVSLGLEVIEAEDGPGALAVAETEGGRFDVVLADIGMTGMSGAELVRVLRRRYPGLRAMFMSGYPAGDLIERKVLEPSAILLQKPFGRAELASRLAAILSTRGASEVAPAGATGRPRPAPTGGRLG